MIKFLYKIYYKLFPLEMVSWWKKQEAVQAKLTVAKEGHNIMWMKGEKYPFPGYPRGHLLYGTLSPLKHQIKVQVFNDSWWKLEKGVSKEEVLRDMRGPILRNILEFGEASKYDMVSYDLMVPSVKEMHRAWTALTDDKDMLKLRDIFLYIMQEDDAYRMRFQFWLPWAKKSLEKGFDMLEHAEIVGDMKERIRLIKRILLLDPTFLQAFVDELDINKVKLTKADKYFFRAKYFRPDLGDPDTYLGKIKNEVIY